MTGAQHDLSLIIPAYNEEANIEVAIDRAVEVCEALFAAFEIIVVDDGSTDRTPEIVTNMARDDPRIRHVRHAQNGGYGEAIRTGLGSATMELVFFTDADNQFDLWELEAFVPLIDRVDVVAGYRIKRQDPLGRRVSAKAWNQLVRALLYVPVRDIDCAFKLFRRSTLAQIQVESVGAMVNTEMMVKLGRAGAGVIEVGVTHYPRTAGKARGNNPRVILRAFYELISMYSRLREPGSHRAPAISEGVEAAHPTTPHSGRSRVTQRSLERQRAKGTVAIVGGGIGGATCALRLAQQGRKVVLLEATPVLGGLVTSFQVSGTPLECFYHHIFPNEADVIGLIDELGLGERLTWLPSSTGIYTGGKVWPFTTPRDLMAFSPLSLKDRIHAGIGALRLTRVRDWESLDELPAQEWLRSYCGEAAASLVWRPLLGQKFGPAAPNVPATWMWGRLQQRNGARGREADKASGEKLGYLRGGFAQMFEGLHKRLVELGVDVRTGSPVKSIDLTEGERPSVRGVTTADGTFIEADEVVFAGTIPRLAGLLPTSVHDARWTDARGLGAMCVILELRHSLQDQYWVNVCDDTLPFGGIIEHTNFVPPEDYGGRRIVYLSRYFTSEESVASCDPDDEAKRWTDLLLDRFPAFDRADVLDIHAFRTPYAAPLVHLGYKAAIPPIKSEVGGLWVATTAQIYPQDRGMNEGVRLGTLVATSILADRSRPKGSSGSAHRA